MSYICRVGSSHGGREEEEGGRGKKRRQVGEKKGDLPVPFGPNTTFNLGPGKTSHSSTQGTKGKRQQESKRMKQMIQQ